MSIYDVITPRSILSWMRVMVANRMASSGKQWIDVFSKYNSGTYNNQVTWNCLSMIPINAVR